MDISVGDDIDENVFTKAYEMQNLLPAPLCLDDDSHDSSSDVFLSPMISTPSQPRHKKRKIEDSLTVPNSTTSSDIHMLKTPLSSISSQSAPDLQQHHQQQNTRFRFDCLTTSYCSSSTPQSDRFIPHRGDMSDTRNSFNLTDEFDHSPLSVVTNTTLRERKPVPLNRRHRKRDYSALRIVGDAHSPSGDSHSDAASSASATTVCNSKYDACLQSILLSNHEQSELKKQPTCYADAEAEAMGDDDDSEYMLSKQKLLQPTQHFDECPLSSALCVDTKENVPGDGDGECLCTYILKNRINYQTSPRKVLQYTTNQNQTHQMYGDAAPQQSISCLGDDIAAVIQQHDDDNQAVQSSASAASSHSSLNIPDGPMKNIDLTSYANRQSNAHQLLNDYYYHLMDFQCNTNLGCIVIGDAVHIISGHFGDLQDAEDNRYIHAENKRQHVNQDEYHFCSVKLAPRGNQSNAHQLCLGDNVGRLLFYDYVRGQYTRQTEKSNKCRISVIDWRNCHGSYNGLVAVGSLDKHVRVYDDRSAQKSVLKLRYHRGEVCGLKWNENNEFLLLSGGNQNMVCLWDIRKKSKPLFVGTHNAAIRALSWYPNKSGTDAQHMFVSGGGSNDQSIKIWNIYEPKEVYQIVTGSQVCNLQYLSYNKQNYLISSHGFSSNSVIVWDMQQHLNNRSSYHLQRIKQLNGHKCRVLYLSKYSDCNIVTAAAGPDQSLKFWKIFPNQNLMSSPFNANIR